jgi:hypothetical protein
VALARIVGLLLVLAGIWSLISMIILMLRQMFGGGLSYWNMWY